MTVTIKKKGAGGPKTVDWGKIKLDFLRRNTDKDADAPYVLKDVARDNGLSHSFVKKRAMAKHPANNGKSWHQQLKAMQDKAAVTGISVLKKDMVFDEYDMRKRHSNLAKLQQFKGGARIQSVDPDNISIAEAANLIKMGIHHERQAMGIPDSVQPLGDIAEGGGESRSDRISRHAAQRAFSKRYLDWKRQSLIKEHGELIEIEVGGED